MSAQRRRYAYADFGDGKRQRVLKVYHMGIPGCVIRFTDDCSGCTEWGDYGSKYGPSGCEECGYTGKRRREEWVPLPGYSDAYFKATNRRWKRRMARERRAALTPTEDPK